MNREKFLSVVTDALADALAADGVDALRALTDRMTDLDQRAAARYKRILGSTYNNVANPGETQRRLRRFATNAELRVMAETVTRTALKAGIDRAMTLRLGGSQP